MTSSLISGGSGFDTRGVNFSSILSPSVACYNTPPSEPNIKVQAHEYGASCIAFSPFGSKVASGGGDGVVKLWNADTGQEEKTAKASYTSVTCLEFNMNGQLLAAGDMSSEITLLETKNTLHMKRKLQGHSDRVNNCKFTSTERNKLISVSSDRTLKIWDVSNGKVLKSFAFSSAPHAIDVSTNDNYFASGHKNGEIRLWSLTDPKEIQRLKVHTDQITSLKFSRDGSEIITSSKDHEIKITEIRTMQTVATLEHQDLNIPATAGKFALAASGKYLAIGGTNGSLFVFDLEKREFEEEFSGNHTTSIFGADWDQSHVSRVATIDSMGMLFIWE